MRSKLNSQEYKDSLKNSLFLKSRLVEYRAYQNNFFDSDNKLIESKLTLHAENEPHVGRVYLPPGEDYATWIKSKIGQRV